jgi:hypothetical protein
VTVSDALPTGNTLEIARAYTAQGLSVIPVKADGSKAPKLSGWREYAVRLATDAELTTWFENRIQPAGIGLVCGAASGNLVVLDFEHKGGACVFSEWRTGLDPALAAYLTTCPIVRTPSGGRHVWVRLPELVEGGKLARFANGKTKIEVRGEGHQVLVPGCPLACHASGEPYAFESWGWVQ